MKIKFFNPAEIEKPIRLAVHKSGKLGFSKEAEVKLGLGENASVAIGRNEEDEADENLYLVPFKDEEPGTFKVSKSGEYYYVNTRYLFDTLKIDYETNQIAFDMTRMEIDGQVFFKLKPVSRSKRKEETKTNDMTDELD